MMWVKQGYRGGLMHLVLIGTAFLRKCLVVMILATCCVACSQSSEPNSQAEVNAVALKRIKEWDVNATTNPLAAAIRDEFPEEFAELTATVGPKIQASTSPREASGYLRSELGNTTKAIFLKYAGDWPYASSEDLAEAARMEADFLRSLSNNPAHCGAYLDKGSRGLIGSGLSTRRFQAATGAAIAALGSAKTRQAPRIPSYKPGDLVELLRAHNFDPQDLQIFRKKGDHSMKRCELHIRLFNILGNRSHPKAPRLMVHIFHQKYSRQRPQSQG